MNTTGLADNLNEYLYNLNLGKTFLSITPKEETIKTRWIDLTN